MCRRQKWGGGVIVGVRFTLVRLAPLDIPDIPTSGMLEAPPSSGSTLGAAEGSGGLLCCQAHTGKTLWLNRNHIPSNLRGHGNMQCTQTSGLLKLHP